MIFLTTIYLSLFTATSKFHDSARITGENAAGNSGTGSWAEMRTPEQILTRFVEREVGKFEVLFYLHKMTSISSIL